jgi:hypothetical protein
MTPAAVTADLEPGRDGGPPPIHKGHDMTVDMDDLDHEATPGGCLAYAIYVMTGGLAEQTHGEHSDLVADLVGDQAGDVEVLWVYSEERCAQDECAYCKRWCADATVCPGLWAHTCHAFARQRNRPALADLELHVGLFLVPHDLPMGGLLASVLAQIRTGVRYALTH